MVRLFRLGRIIAKLRMKPELKIGYRIFELLFLLVLLLHWLCCIWYMAVDLPGTQEWIPPKDLDAQETTFFTTDSKTKQYLVCFYYATLLIVGNESGPNTIA